MNDSVKSLQQLTETLGGASTLEWSTISHTHGKNAAVGVNAMNADIDTNDAFSLVKQLQALAPPNEASPLEWSTISHTHKADK